MRKKPISVYWGVDTEFDVTKHEIHSVQVYNNSNSFFLTNKKEIQRFFNDFKPRLMFGFNVLCDIGALETILDTELKKTKIGSQICAWYKYSSSQPACMIRDLKPYADAMGLYNLAKVGEYVGVDKLDRTALKVVYSDDFKRYAMKDAEITYRFAEKICKDLKIPPNKIFTPASYSATYIEIPKRYIRHNGRVIIPPIEEKIRYNTFAGRSECFLNGYLENYVYLDVASLYPASLLISEALKINKIVECNPNELNLTDCNHFGDYGWIEGEFSSKNDMWGLPVRVTTTHQNRYVTGRVSGFFHTYDILAARAKPVKVTKCYKPEFKELPAYQTYYSLFRKKIEKKYTNIEDKNLTKMVLNSLTGKLAQNKPVPALTSNFGAYQTIVACSHLIMSNIFEMCDSQHIAGMDTDSVFIPDYDKLSGCVATYNNIPIILDIKHDVGDLVYLRSKMYSFLDGKGVAYHGWRYGYKSFIDLFSGQITDTISLMKPIKRTLKTREKEALKMPIGFWSAKKIVKNKDEIVQLCRADLKRNRENYNSFELFENKENGRSFAYLF